MGLFARIIKHKKPVLVLFVIFAAICIVLTLFVRVNYNLVDYLPPDAQSTTALEIMEREFDAAMPNASVMVKDVDLMAARAYKDELAAIAGVEQVLWLDDVMDLKQPLETGDADTIAGFYKERTALFSLTIAKGMEKEACNEILQRIGADNALTGDAPSLVFVQNTATSTVLKAMAILVPVIIAILILSTSSWLEPLLFLLTIGIAIVLNMGTNLIFGEISFMTNSISPILQLACSLDYAVFLLHSFQDNRKKFARVEDAMRQAMKESLSTVAASAATTLFGFLALLFMNFRIGADLGITLAKGIIFSFVTVMVFLPALTLYLYKWIDRTQHRPFLPDFGRIGRLLSKIAVPAVLIITLLLVPAFLGQRQTHFLYGNDVIDPSTRYGRDTVAVEQHFGRNTMMAILVPRGEVAKEEALCDELGQIAHVTGVTAYATHVGAAIPPEFLGDALTDSFYGPNYARILLYLDTEAEGEVAFQTVERIHEQTRALYGDGFYTLGQSANLYDMKSIVQKDNVYVNLIAIAAIFAVLLLTFRSLTLPFLLVLTIEAGIWINLAVPYFNGTPINFLGYLVLSTIQLGATVDYAILLTHTYLRNRQTMRKRAAMHRALGASFRSILVSTLTLSTAGFVLRATSTNSAIADIGVLLGRGTLLSFSMVLAFLPTLLLLFDRAIARTTVRANFYHPSDPIHQAAGGTADET